MKKFIILTASFVICFSVRAATYIKLNLKNQQSISGEFIEIYEDRWFYEEDDENVEKYILLFEKRSGKVIFHFENLSHVDSVESLKEDKSEYSQFLRDSRVNLSSNLVANQSVLTGNEGHHKFEKMYGNFAWDIGVLDKAGSQYKGDGTDLEDYYIFGSEVKSPVQGIVVGIVSDRPDNKADLSFQTDLSEKINNYLTIKINDVLYLSVVHFQQDSIRVKKGDLVKRGTILGSVGNSGVSYIPHLHYTLYTYIKEYDRFISIPGIPW